MIFQKDGKTFFTLTENLPHGAVPIKAENAPVDLDMAKILEQPISNLEKSLLLMTGEASEDLGGESHSIADLPCTK